MIRTEPEVGDTLNESSLSHPSIRSQLLIVVNVPLALLVLCFFAYDYRRELTERLEEKRISLDEEAKTLLPAITQIRQQSADNVQQYIDKVCGRMRESQSPGHHIAVISPTGTFQALAHGRASPEILEAIRAGAASNSRRIRYENVELVVGVHESSGFTVYVAESLENLRRTIIADVWRRILGVAFLAVVAALVVNVVLTQFVIHPLNRLVRTVRRIGQGQLGARTGRFRCSELNYLAGEINDMCCLLAEAERDRDYQLRKAQKIQENLLPKDVQIPGLRIARLFEPADVIAGDYFDVLRLTRGESLFCIADVTGHGVAAALNAAMIKTVLLQGAEQLTSPSELLAYINRRFLAVNLLGDFVSMLLVRVDAQQRNLCWASAGHPAGWLLAPDGTTREISSTGPLLGILEDAKWESDTLEVAAAERLLMITDGVTETMDPQKRCFGRPRLVDLFTNCRDLPLEPAVREIRRALTNYRDGERQHDDVTALVVEFGPDTPPAGSVPTMASP
ncbi:MAG: PP2C family protein-serine/threonine phosphatase [Pirellulales bacterium]